MSYEKKLEVIELFMEHHSILIGESVLDTGKFFLCHNFDCSLCRVRRNCDKVRTGSFLKFNKEEMEKFYEKYPEYAI